MTSSSWFSWDVSGDSLLRFDQVARDWVTVPRFETVNASFSVTGPLSNDVMSLTLGDEGEEDRVTQVMLDTETVTASADAQPVDGTRTIPPFYLTRAILQELGACGTYIRRFSDAFPTDRYPGGVEINEETCGAHYHVFDWEWAISNMLNQSGRDAYHRIVRSRLPENRRFNTGNVRRARVFGHIFATRPEARNENLDGIEDRALSTEDLRVLRDLGRVKNNITHYEQQLRNINEALQRERERLPELEKVAASAQLRQAHRKKREAEQSLTRMRERFENAQRAVEEATAAVMKFTQAVQDASPDGVTNETGEVKVVKVPDDASILTGPTNYDPFS